MNIMNRWWIKYKDRIIRFLAYENYELCYYGGFPRGFVYRLSEDDPRPLGTHILGGDYSDAYAAWFESLPVGQWVEVV